MYAKPKLTQTLRLDLKTNN